MTLPPVLAGGVKAMLAAVLAGVAAPMVGAAGTVNGVTLAAVDAALAPMPLLAVTVQLYVVPLVSPVTMIGDKVPVKLTGPGAQLMR